jgi:hypothetical protein
VGEGEEKPTSVFGVGEADGRGRGRARAGSGASTDAEGVDAARRRVAAAGGRREGGGRPRWGPPVGERGKGAWGAAAGNPSGPRLGRTRPSRVIRVFFFFFFSFLFKNINKYIFK